MYDIIPEKVQAINKNGGINVEGVVQGLGKPDLVTTDIAETIKDADVIMVVAPAFAHKNITRREPIFNRWTDSRSKSRLNRWRF